MDKRIPVDPVEEVKGILLIPRTSSPTADMIPRDNLAYRTVVCDFHVAGAELGEAKPWGYQHDEFDVVDHHAQDPKWEKHISSVHLAIEYVRLKGFADKVVINHTDCDSILAAMILRGLLLPEQRYAAAAEAADHTGDANDLADLLQALEHERNLLLSMDALDEWLRSEFMSARTKELLAVRSNERVLAKQYAEEPEFLGRAVWIRGEENLEAAFLLPFVPDAWVIVFTFPMPRLPGDRHDRTCIKVRRGKAAPDGLSLHALGIKGMVERYGGRWNAGSNHRGGGTVSPPFEVFVEIADAVNKYSDQRQLARAIAIAAEAHAGQFDKGGNPYVLHPLRVMLRQQDDVSRMVGVLHDVVEDCPGWTFERLKEEGFSDEVLDALRLVTNPPGFDSKDVEAYIGKAMETAWNRVAKAVKLADIEDNLDVSGIAVPQPRDFARFEKYRTARKMLLEAGPKGDLLLPIPERDINGSMQAFEFKYLRSLTIPCRVVEGKFLDTRTRRPVTFRDGSFVAVRGHYRAFENVAHLEAYMDITSQPFLERDTSLFVAVDQKRVPEHLRAHTWDPYGPTTDRSHPKFPGGVSLPRPSSEKDNVYVHVILKEDLMLEHRGLESAKALPCKVWIPSLEMEVGSLNQAYSAVAREFEPDRKSVAGNIFRRVYKLHEDQRDTGKQYRPLIVLGDLRRHAEAVILSRAMAGIKPAPSDQKR